jgi:hypothetical protein
MEIVEDKSFFALIGVHYNFITIFEKNMEWKYIPNSLLFNKSKNLYTLSYQIGILTNNNDNEFTESYRSSEFFNQEPRVY